MIGAVSPGTLDTIPVADLRHCAISSGPLIARVALACDSQCGDAYVRKCTQVAIGTVPTCNSRRLLARRVPCAVGTPGFGVSSVYFT